MSETGIAERAPLTGFALPERTGAVRTRDAGPLARFIVRGDAAPVGAGFGLALPGSPRRAVAKGDRAALWLGPDEWLLIAPRTEGAALARALTAASGTAASVVEVSHRQTGLIVEGAGAAGVLSAGCPLDLDLATFPAGECTRTIFGKTEIVLWRTAPDRFHVEVWRSSAPYVAGLLGEAMRDAA